LAKPLPEMSPQEQAAYLSVKIDAWLTEQTTNPPHAYPLPFWFASDAVFDLLDHYVQRGMDVGFLVRDGSRFLEIG